MRVLVTDGAAAMGAAAAALVLEALAADPGLVLGVATGSTPSTTYRELAAARVRGVDFSGIRLVALDEYVGLPLDHPASYHAVVRREIAEPLGIPTDSVLVPSGSGAELEERIRELGCVDLQLLGIGRNGHLAFNEPGSALDSRTRVVRLTATTRADNARFFDDRAKVPLEGVTQGLGTILEARRLLLLADGDGKAAAVAAALEGPVTPDVPASVLQWHPEVTAVLTQSAASALERSLKSV